MAGYRRIYIDGGDFYSLDTAGSNNNVIYLNPLAYMAVHTGVISGLQDVWLQGVELEEVAVANVDVLANVGKYAVTATNSVGFIVAKSVATEADAKNYISGHLIEYQMVALEYDGADDIYTMQTYAADGTLIGVTRSSSLSTLTERMQALDGDLNVNNAVGYYYHTLIRSLIAS